MSGSEVIYFLVITKIYLASRPTSLTDDITIPYFKLAVANMVRVSVFLLAGAQEGKIQKI